MSVAVIVPYRGGCPHREAAWSWVRKQYEALDWEVVVGSPPPGPWCKARAVLDGLRQTDADRLVISDADVWCAGIPEATEMPDPIVIPHRLVHRLNRASTELHLAGQPQIKGYERDPYIGRAGGGITVIDRDTWNEVPMDPRFVGWGQEDDSWCHAFTTVIGRPTRLRHDLIHLWHPPQPKMNRCMGSPESKALLHRYESAQKRPDAMRALLAEFVEEMAA